MWGCQPTTTGKEDRRIEAIGIELIVYMIAAYIRRLEGWKKLPKLRYGKASNGRDNDHTTLVRQKSIAAT